MESDCIGACFLFKISKTKLLSRRLYNFYPWLNKRRSWVGIYYLNFFIGKQSLLQSSIGKAYRIGSSNKNYGGIVFQPLLCLAVLIQFCIIFIKQQNMGAHRFLFIDASIFANMEEFE